MRIKISGTQREVSTEQRLQIERILRFSLSRFENLVRDAQVRFLENGPAAECQVQLRLRSGESVTAEERSQVLDAALRQATQRAAGILDRSLHLRQPEPQSRLFKKIQFGD